MKLFVMMLALAGFASQTQAAGLARRVELLGETKLSYSKDRDVIQLGRCDRSPNDPVRAVKIRVLRQGAEINRLVVVYGNGAAEELGVRQYFRENEESRWIDLRGGQRCITRIGIVGDTQSLFPIGPHSRVQVWGAR